MARVHTCGECDHHTKNHECDDAALLLYRATDHPACRYFLKRSDLNGDEIDAIVDRIV